MKKSILVVIFLSVANIAHAQSPINYYFNGSDIFGAGGEIPVIDNDNLAENTVTAIKTTAMLIDMLLQALNGGGPQNETTAALSTEISALSDDGYAHTYGSYDLGTWNDAHAITHVYPEGGWVRNEEDRYKRSITTYRALQRMLQLRKEALPADQERAQGIYDAVIGCQGRNCAIQATGSAVSELVWQSHIQQQLEMASVNAQNVYYAHQINEDIARKAQERYFVSNADEPVQALPFSDVGLY